MDIKSVHRFSFYDSFMIAEAIGASAKILYSEDLQHGQEIGDIAIINPLL